MNYDFVSNDLLLEDEIIRIENQWSQYPIDDILTTEEDNEVTKLSVIAQYIGFQMAEHALGENPFVISELRIFWKKGQDNWRKIISPKIDSKWNKEGF